MEKNNRFRPFSATFIVLALSFIVLFSGQVSAFNFSDGYLMGEYKLDELSGTLAYDTSGNQKNMTNIGTATIGQLGKFNYSYLFDGSNDGLNVSSFGSLNPNMSYEFWVWTNDSDGGIIQNYAASSTRDTVYIIGGKMVFESASTSGNTIYWTTTSSVPQNQWVHYILRINSSLNGEIWMNGVNQTTTVGKAGSPARPTGVTTLYVDADYTPTTKNFAGYLDSIRIWNRTLSSSEITELYTLSNLYVEILPTSPENNSILSTEGTNFTANFTISNENPGGYVWKNMTVYVWNNNGSLFNTNFTTLSGNVTTGSVFVDDFVLGQNYIWNVNGCFGNATYNNCSFGDYNYTFVNLPFRENNVSYTPSVLETILSNFNLSITTNPQVSSLTGVFNYNGTTYSTTLLESGSGIYTAYNNIDIPLQDGNGNKSFYWTFNFTLEDGTKVVSNSSIYSQEVNRTFLVLCNSTYNTTFINFTSKSAENPFPIINSIFKSAWEWYIDGGTGSVKRNYSFENVTGTGSNFKFCGSHNLTYITDAEIEYEAPSYSLNFYYLNDAELTNSTQDISLYLLNESKSIATTLKVVDDSQTPLEDVTIQIQFYDVGTGTFYLVGMGKTDFKGEEIAYLNWYDTLYKFVFIKDGEIIKTTNTTKISSTPVTFNVLEDETFLYNKFKDFIYSLTFNNETNNFVLTFTKPSGLVDQGCLRVIKRTGKEDTEICLTCESSTSATVYCNLNGAGNGTYIAHFYATGSFYDIDWIVKTIGENFMDQIRGVLDKEDSALYSFIIGILIIFISFISPIFGIIAAILSILLASILGFAPLNYVAFMGILFIGGIILWILKR